MNKRWVAIGLVALCLLGVTGPVRSAGEYSVSARSSFDVPDTEVTVEGTTWEITEVGKVDEGNALTFSAQTPADDPYTVSLYNADKQIVDAMRRTSDGTYSFDTSYLSQGTYSLALEQDSEIHDVQMIVISGYSFDVAAPATVNTSETIDVTVSLSQPDPEPRQVDVVIFNETWEHTTEATKVGTGKYNVSISEEMVPGDYTLYAGTRGDDKVNGEYELSGLSQTHTLSVEEPSTSTPTPTTTEPTTTESQSNPGGSGGSNPPAGGNQPGATTTDGPTSTRMSPITNTTTTKATTDGPQPTTSQRSTDDTQAQSTTLEPTANGTGNVLQPASTTPEPTTTSQPGPTTPLFVGVGFIVTLLLMWQRSS